MQENNRLALLTLIITLLFNIIILHFILMNSKRQKTLLWVLIILILITLWVYSFQLDTTISLLWTPRLQSNSFLRFFYELWHEKNKTLYIDATIDWLFLWKDWVLSDTNNTLTLTYNWNFHLDYSEYREQWIHQIALFHEQFTHNILNYWLLSDISISSHYKDNDVYVTIDTFSVHQPLEVIDTVLLWQWLLNSFLGRTIKIEESLLSPMAMIEQSTKNIRLLELTRDEQYIEIQWTSFDFSWTYNIATDVLSWWFTVPFYNFTWSLQYINNDVWTLLILWDDLWLWSIKQFTWTFHFPQRNTLELTWILYHTWGNMEITVNIRYRNQSIWSQLVWLFQSWQNEIPQHTITWRTIYQNFFAPLPEEGAWDADYQ